MLLAATFVAPAAEAAAAAPPTGRWSESTSLRLRTWNGYIRSTDGVRLWVHSVGGGAEDTDVVVFVHGGPGLSHRYLHVFNRLASRDRQIVSYDQRGAGRSTRPADKRYGFHAQLSDLAAVRRWSRARDITVVGHSFGGLFAAAFAATRPRHVDGLVLLDAVPLNWSAFRAGLHRRLARVTALQKAGLIPKRLPPVRHDSCLARVKATTPAYLADPRNPVRRRKVWGPDCTASTAKQTVNDLVRQRGMVPKLGAELRHWSGRAFVMEGARDPFGLGWLHNSVAELHSAATHVRIVRRAGHFPWIERRTVVLRRLARFLR